MYNLTRQEIKDVIDGVRCAKNVPMLYDIWVSPESFPGREDEARKLEEETPCDMQSIFLNFPDIYKAPDDNKNYKWASNSLTEQADGGLDAKIVVKDWDEIEQIYEEFPSAEYEKLIPDVKVDPNRYSVGRWWYCYYERLWSLRGMKNALMDFYLYPDEVHRLFDKLTQFYLRAMERAKKELNVDAIFVGDDIGTQAGPFFSPAIFKEFLKPYYKQLIDKAHELGMHFWLHSCGNIELFLDDFVEIGLDVIHPIQKFAMNQIEVAKKYIDRICILVGFDVQHTIPYGTPDEVKKEVREIIDALANEKGRFMLTLGNGSTNDWKLESLKALYDETYSYGEKKFGQLLGRRSDVQPA